MGAKNEQKAADFIPENPHHTSKTPADLAAADGVVVSPTRSSRLRVDKKTAIVGSAVLVIVVAILAGAYLLKPEAQVADIANLDSKLLKTKPVPFSETRTGQTQDYILKVDVPADASLEDRVGHERSIAQFYATRNDYQKAYEHYKAALKLVPDDTDTLIQAAQTAQEISAKDTVELYKKAFSQYKTSVVLNASASAADYYTLAKLAVGAGVKTEAKTYYDKVISLTNNSSDEEDIAFAKAASEESKKL